jgi:hypothetical protein
MSEMSSGADHGPGRYEIRLTGRLHPRWAGWFDGMTVVDDDDGTTVLRGYVVDQSALHGLLHKVRDIGLPLVSVVRVPADESPVPPADPAPHTTSP